MALKDTFKSLFNYFEVDDTVDYGGQESYQMTNDSPVLKPASLPKETEEKSVQEQQRRSSTLKSSHSVTNIQRLNERQKELRVVSGLEKEERTTIDIKFPKRYEDAVEVVNLLLDNASILIDFQYMSEQQARRCLDYLDGARSVLAGNLKKVSSTMWLLTPVNVRVNIEELRHANTAHYSEGSFDFDMKR